MCPRRSELGGMPLGDDWPTEDTWRTVSHQFGVPDVVEGMTLRSCTWCGSLHPEDFLALASKGYTVGPTDKNYKVYLMAPPDDLDDRIATMKTRPVYRALVEQRGQAAADEWAAAEGSLIMGGTTIGKFYTQHLSPEQGDRFRALVDQRKMIVGFPGYFYARIYVPQTEAEAAAQPQQTEASDGGDQPSS